MQNTALTPDEYIEALPDDRKKAVVQLRKVIKKNLPKGFREVISYGMLGYVVPHTIYPKGYHCDPKLPLPFMAVASQKSAITVHHMGMYADSKLFDWFMKEYPNHADSKPDMGKGCIRFKKPDQIPFQLIGELASKMTTEDWIATYEKSFTKK